MSDYKVHQPVYRAAADTASAELRQIADRLNQLRVRQEQISTAVQALKALVSPQDAAMPRPVYEMTNREMSSRAPQPGHEAVKLQALA